MLRKFMLLCLLFQFLTKTNCQVINYKPLHREVHTATLINNKLFILGGVRDHNESLSDLPGDAASKAFFYLDVSVPFSTQNLTWIDLTDENIIPPHSSAAYAVGGINNDTLIIYGGNSNQQMGVYTYNPQANKWHPQTTTGVNNVWKSNVMGIIDHDGRLMYLWGGRLGTIEVFNDMLILNTINFNFSYGSNINAPSRRYNYGAVLLPNNKIIYTGGYNNTAELELDQIYIYDTINNIWSSELASGQMPSNRDGFSAVLGLDGQTMIIFGGSTDVNSDISNLRPEDALYVLDLTNYKWYIPNISGNLPNSRVFHRANVIGKYMVISFGATKDDLPTESDILLLDISNNYNYTWTNNFEPPTFIVKPGKPNPAIVVGAVIGGVFGLTLLSVGCIFLYKWIKNRKNRKQNNPILIPGSESYNHKRKL